MEFDEPEEELQSQIYHGTTPNEGAPLTPSGSGGSGIRSGGAVAGGGDVGGNNSGSGVTYRYKQCMKNHAVGIGLTAVDGCGEFIAAGEDGTLEALRCAACNCHRNFHRKEVIAVGFHQYPSPTAQFPPYFRASHPSGYLSITPPSRNMVAREEDDDMSNPSSSGGGLGGSRKRHRTKFTQEQKDKMLAFAEKLGWRFQKQDEDAIGQFCNEINVNRQVFKVWMHNNKHTMGKKL